MNKITYKCHRCGIVLASQQSLTYHLNKKTKCNSLKCDNCSGIFPNKSALIIVVPIKRVAKIKSIYPVILFSK